MTRIIPIAIGQRLINATVRYRIEYPSVWHRGHGIECDVDVISVTQEVGTETVPVTMVPGLHDAIVSMLEADDLELN